MKETPRTSDSSKAQDKRGSDGALIQKLQDDIFHTHPNEGKAFGRRVLSGNNIWKTSRYSSEREHACSHGLWILRPAIKHRVPRVFPLKDVKLVGVLKAPDAAQVPFMVNALGL